jgi:hypothetical protein
VSTDVASRTRRSVMFPDDQWEALTELAAINGTNTSDEIRFAVAEYLTRHGVEIQPPDVPRTRMGTGRRPQ